MHTVERAIQFAERPCCHNGLEAVAPFTITVDHQLDLAVVTAVGELDADMSVAAMHLPGFGQTRLLMWDLRRASLSALDPDAMTTIGREYAATDNLRRTRFAAFVVGNTEAKMLLNYYREMSRHILVRPLQQHITTDFTQACLWLNGAVGKQDS